MTAQTTPAFRRVLLAMMRQQPLRYTFAMFLWMSVWTMPILIGLITARYFEILVEGATVETITLAVIAVLAFATTRSVIIVIAMRNHASLLFRASAAMRRNLLVRIYELPGAAGLSESPGEIVSRFRDDIEHVIEPFDLFVDFAGSLLTAAISFAIMWTIDPATTLAVAVPVVVVSVVSNRTGGLVRRYRREARDATESIAGFLGETFAAVQSVKVSGAEADMLEHFNELNDDRKAMMVRDRTLTSVLEAGFRNTVNVGTGLILLLAAGTLGATGSSGMSLAEFALFVYLLTLTAVSAHFYGVFMARAKQGSVSMERLTASLSGEPWQRLFEETDLGLDRDTPAPIPQVESVPSFESLSAHGLSFRYENSTNGIDDIDIDIAAGEFVVVTGRIGSGKTTLLRCLLGLLRADTGTIAWNGRPVDDPSSWLIPPRVAYTPQVPRLFSMSLMDNLVLGAELSDGQLDESIHISTMRRDIEQMPEGLKTLIGPRGVRLSGGQVQRSAAARMFVRVPQLLVLDDVSSALDVETEQTLWRRLFEIRSDVAALVVSHRKTALARADRIIVMEKGRIVAVGTAKELTRSSQTFREIWGTTHESSSPEE